MFSTDVKFDSFKDYENIHFSEQNRKFNMSAGHFGQALVLAGLVLAGLMLLNLLVFMLYVAIPHRHEALKNFARK